MKKSLLALLFAVALAVPALAENMWIGGNLSYENASIKGGSEDQSMNSLTIAPEFGYNLNEKWDIGLDLAYTTGKGTKTKNALKPNTIKESPDVTDFKIAPFARYHVMQIGDFDFMLKGTLFYDKTNYKYDGSSENKLTGYGIAIAPVVSYSINETWSIGCTLNFLELGYMHLGDDDVSDNKYDEFGFNVNNGSIIGVNFSYHF